jgi:16S rRNA (guanine527-N7)-methyltransferase
VRICRRELEPCGRSVDFTRDREAQFRFVYDGIVEPARIGTLVKPYANLAPEQLKSISKYIDLILKWNRKINLTAIRDPEEIVTRHFGESFFAASQWLVPERAKHVIDIGSGAGFPGLPFAMYSPSARVNLIESHGKKAAFLNEVIFTLGMGNAKVFNCRAEQFGSQGDLVTLRAVEKFEQVLPLAARLVRPGGRLGLMVGAAQVPRAVASESGFEWGAPIPVPGAQTRVLVRGTKAVNVGQT